MATFIPNVTDVFPGSSEYNPDWNRIERMLRLRQKMYDDGARKVKTLYDSIFNAPMLRPSDIQRRDSYLKIISDNLNRVSAMDLSIKGNEDMANNLMLPVTEDQNIIHDISYTRKGREEASRAESLRTSSNYDERVKYWDIGMKDINYQMEDYAKSSDSEALQMKPPTYTPNVDIQKFAEKRFKESGISVKRDVIDGAYIWTKKNGDEVYPIAESYVNTLLQQDPAVRDMMVVEARVKRRDMAKSKALSDGISEQDAEVLYITDVIQTAGRALIQNNVNTSKDVAALKKKMESWDKLITTKGIIPGSKEHLDYLADLDKLTVLEQGLEDNTNLGNSVNTINFSNLQEARDAADALVAANEFGKKSKQIAAFLSTKDMEVKVRDEPYTMAEYRAILNRDTQKIMEGIRQRNRKEMADYNEDIRNRRPGGPGGTGSNDPDGGGTGGAGNTNIDPPRTRQ